MVSSPLQIGLAVEMSGKTLLKKLSPRLSAAFALLVVFYQIQQMSADFRIIPFFHATPPRLTIPSLGII